MNNLRIEPGERFRLGNDRILMIDRVEGRVAIVVDEKTGGRWSYGTDALKHLIVERVVEHEADRP